MHGINFFSPMKVQIRKETEGGEVKITVQFVLLLDSLDKGMDLCFCPA